MYYRNILLHLVLLLALCVGLFFFRLGDRALSSSHEARAAQNAQSILHTNFWLVPQLFDRTVELQKPPLYYWMVALLAKCSDAPVNAWMVRLPAALSATGCVLVIYLLGVLRGRAMAGLLSATVLATFVHFTWLARVGRIDMVLTFCVTVMLASFYLGECRRNEHNGTGSWKWYLLAYFFAGLGLLVKGPVAVVLPGVVIAVFLSIELCNHCRSHGFTVRLPLRLGHDLGMWWGLPLIVVIAVPWYVLANEYTHGDLFRVFFWYHNLARAAGSANELEIQPWWFYGPRLLIDLLPWSPALLAALVLGTWKRHGVNGDTLAGFGLVWFFAIVLLLSCVQFKRADYLAPAYPGAALLLGTSLEACWRKIRAIKKARLQRLAPIMGISVVLGCICGWWYFATVVVPAQDAHNPSRRLALEMRKATAGTVLFFRTESHEVALHAGSPIETLMEWENLRAWIARPEPVTVLMSAELADVRHEYLGGLELVELYRSSDYVDERPLAVLQSISPTILTKGP